MLNTFVAFVTGMHSLRRAKILAAVLVLSVGIWTLEALSYGTENPPLFNLRASRDIRIRR